MKQTFDVTCPVSDTIINENVARAAAFFVILFTSIGVYYNSYIIIGLLAIDFGIRAFTSGNFSPIRAGAKFVVKILSIQHKPVDGAPKKFAAGLGMAFCILIACFQFFNYIFAAQLVGAILIFCALLEGVIGFCIGCIVYSWIIFPWTKKGI